MEQKANVRGKGSYPLSSMMTRLNYLMEVPSSCGLEDANLVDFIEVTSIIAGRVAVEEFLSCGLWPLSEQFGFKVEKKSLPCRRFWCRCHKSIQLLGLMSLELNLRHASEMPQICWWARTMLQSTTLIKGFNIVTSGLKA
jgi:hypothetical protein